MRKELEDIIKKFDIIRPSRPKKKWTNSIGTHGSVKMVNLKQFLHKEVKVKTFTSSDA